MGKSIFYLISIFAILGVYQKLLSQNENIEVTSKRNLDKSVDITYTKKLPGSYYIKLEFITMENCNQYDFEGVIKKNSGRLVKLEPVNSDKDVNFSYKFVSIKGNPNPKIDKNFNYVLPFKIGKTIKIMESTSLKEKYFNAEKDLNWKSYTVDRITADTIYNMRKGIVIEINDEFKSDSLYTYKYTSKMNKVFIEHKDGTISRFIGFNRNSIFVKLGQTVYPQTKIGVLDIFNNSIYRLYFDISYLKNIDFNSNKRTLSSENQMGYITPYFYISNEPITLKNNNKYIVEIDDAILFKEFTKREIKKYKKTPQLFE